MAEVQVTAGSLTENDSHPRNSQPLVSVIIPVYNAEKYVEQAVRSIMNQTYQNLEILITDDWSTDGSFEILKKLSEEDSRIKLFRNTENQKIVRTLNALVERASGKYIARMDADDISLAKRIEKQVAFLEANPDIALCGTNAFCIDVNSKIISKVRFPIRSEDCKYFLKYSTCFFHPSIFINAQILKENPYSEFFLYAEDYELWVRLLCENNLEGTNLQEPLLYYRTYGEQSSAVHSDSQIDTVSKILSCYDLVDDLQNHMNIFYKKFSCNFASERVYIKRIFKENKKQSFYLRMNIFARVVVYFRKTGRLKLIFLILPHFLGFLYFGILKIYDFFLVAHQNYKNHLGDMNYAKS